MEKLQETILYIAERSKDDPRFGATKLNKLLFIADFLSYANWGKSITEASYKRLPMGPVPHELPIAREALLATGRVNYEEQLFYGRPQKRIVPNDKPNIDLLEKQEVKLIDDIIQTCWHLNGTNLSEWSHKFSAWLDAEDNEEIPYYTVFLMNDWPVGFEDLKWGENKLEEMAGQKYEESDLLYAEV